MKSAIQGGTGATHLSNQHFAEVVEALRHAAGQGAGHDRRRITRIEAQTDLQVALYENGACGRDYTVLTRDVSIGGIGLLQSHPAKTDDLLAIRLPRLQRPPLFVLSRVTHSRRMADGIYGIGAEFQHLLTVAPTQDGDIEKIRKSILD